jgi:3-oxoacyl-ACP reductase-like protein
MDWIMQNYDVVIDVVTAVIAAAGGVAAIFPAGGNAG